MPGTHSLHWLVITALATFCAAAASAQAHGQSSPRRCLLTPELRIGAVDGTQSLTAVTSILLAPDGSTLYVAQPRDRQIRIVSAGDGRLVRVIGSRGAGPGEFQTVSRLTWRHDTLVVADKAQQRIALFTSAGDHLRTESVASAPMPQTRRPAVGVALDPSGRAWGEPQIDMMSVAHGVVEVSPIVRLSRTGEVEATIAEMKLSGSMAFADYGTGVAVFVQPLARAALREFAPDGESVVVVDNASGSDARFTVTRVTFTGDTVLRRSYRHTPRRLTANQRDSIYGSYAGMFSRGTTPAQAQRAAREHVTLPAVQPPVSDVMIGMDGRIWLRREEVSAPDTWAVLNAQGDVDATCTAPPGVKLLAAARNHAWGVRDSDIGVPYVLRLRLVVQ